MVASNYLVYIYKSQELDDIEITISCWKDKESVNSWANNPIHIETKERAKIL